MVTKEQARARVLEEIHRLPHGLDPDGIVILDEHTIEKPWGWVFFYQSRRSRETGDERWLVGGNAPYIVNRHDGSLHETGTAHPIQHYIREYEATLDDSK